MGHGTSLPETITALSRHAGRYCFGTVSQGKTGQTVAVEAGIHARQVAASGQVARNPCPQGLGSGSGALFLLPQPLRHAAMMRAGPLAGAAEAECPVPAVGCSPWGRLAIRSPGGRCEKRWNGHYLIEVKSSNSQKEEHIPDVAVHAYIAAACGVEINSAEFMHLNKEFRNPDVGDLFARTDVTEAVAKRSLGCSSWQGRSRGTSTTGCGRTCSTIVSGTRGRW